jgi:hypothetical protein
MGHLLKIAFQMTSGTYSNYFVTANNGVGYTTPTGACGSPTGGPILYSGVYMGTGTYIFVDEQLNGTFNGQNLWYRLYNPVWGYSVTVQIASNGQIVSSYSCP